MLRNRLEIREYFFILVFAGVYFISAKLGLSLAMVHSSISAVWPPTGLSLAILIIFGTRYWPGVFIGAFFANITTEGTVLTSLFIALGNSLEALFGVYAINMFARGRRAFENLQDTIKFLFFGGILSPIISATVGVSTLFLAGFSGSTPYFNAWLTWWLGDASSAIVIVPFIILWANDRDLKFGRQQILEIILISLTLGIVARSIFGGFLFQDNYPLEFLVIPVLAWVSVRFTPRGAMTSVIIITIVSIWGTLHGDGPFIGLWPANNSLIFLQAFLMTIAATSLALAVTVWERKKVELALQKADQTKDEFLTTLSHELRNPLASVFGYLQLIQIGSAKYSKKKKAIENIESDLRHMTSLLDDLLDLSRVRRGKIKLQKELLEVNALIKEVTTNMKLVVEEQKQILNIDKKYDGPLWINADSKRVKQVLVNLLSNAVKYTPTRGSIWVSSYKEDGNAYIEVRDTGKGLTSEMISKIFDMFNQVGRPATRTEKGFRGLGIGLTVVKKFVELHGGSVKAESEGLGKGSTFTISFPMIEKPIKVEASRFNIEKKKNTIENLEELRKMEKIKNRNRKLRIMVVDDNERAADSLFELLTHFGHEVAVSYTGVDALRNAQKWVPEVVILDIGLPDIDGHEVATELRKRYKNIERDLLLIALSGYGQPEDIRRSEEAGFNYHLVKPVDIVALQEILMESS